jgi:hypothetical protein
MTENLTALESLGESLTEKKGRLETEFRRLTGARLVATIKAPGSLLSPDLAASLLGLSGRQVRRWMDSTTGLWIPKYSHCGTCRRISGILAEGDPDMEGRLSDPSLRDSDDDPPSGRSQNLGGSRTIGRGTCGGIDDPLASASPANLGNRK